MNTHVIILSSIYDFSSDIITSLLKKKGVSYVRLNKEHFQNYRIGINPSSKEMQIKIEDSIFFVSNPKSFFFRQPVFLRNSPSEPLSLKEQLSRTQWSAFLRSLSIFEDANWINWPQSTYLAENKPYQLSIAQECGLRIPKTLIGNDSIEFQKSFPSKKIIKSIDTVFLKEKQGYLFAYSIVLDDLKFSEENTHEVPFIVQEYIEHKIDCRVTIIGDKVFSVYILKNGSPIEGDWRKTPKDKLSYKSFHLPEDIQKSCLNLLRKLNLRFGAIDLLKNDQGYFFLEINPTGEWGWLCNEKREIGQAIVEELSRDI